MISKIYIAFLNVIIHEETWLEVGTLYVGKGNFVRVHATKTHRRRRFVALLIPNPGAS